MQMLIAGLDQLEKVYNIVRTTIEEVYPHYYPAGAVTFFLSHHQRSHIEEDLRNIGIKAIDDLKGKDPQELYRKDCEFKGFQEDKCQLYVFRLAVYFAETENPDKEKLKWWYWKDKSYPQERTE